jgi:DNA-binding NtrC family response regulator
MNPTSKENARANILVVEDSSVFREMQGLLLRQAGYGVSLHENPRDALQVATKQRFDLVVIDFELPDMNGQEFMHALRKIHPDIAVIFVSGSLTLELAIQLGTQGVAGIFHKPTNPKTLLEKINETLARNAVRDTAARPGTQNVQGRGPDPLGVLRAPPADQLAYTPQYFLGQSDTFRDFSHRLWKVRDFRAALLLQGEPGSPFELIARDLAQISVFRDGPVMVCDADAFEARNLIEVLAPSLLSHDAGTLIVTNVEKFTAAQQKTLENLMTGRDVFLPFARRFRIVLAATSQLTDRVDDGSFGETLYYKISSLSLTVPALRQLRGDISLNAERILAAHRDAGHPEGATRFSPEAVAWLEDQDWAGNYDQLAETVIAAATQTGTPEVSAATLQSVAHEAPTSSAAQPPEMSKPVNADDSKPLTAQSLFRPASRAYEFGTRLAASLAATQPSAAH